jgi:hypothetical protein
VLPLVLAVPDPVVPEPTRPVPELFTTVESGRLPEGGIYAWFAVAAPKERVYAVLADDGAMHTWMPHLARSDVVAAGAPCERVAFAVPSPIGTVTYELNRCHDGASIWWSKADGERFERIDGSYRLSEVPGGTLVRYWSHVVASVPVPSRVQDEVARIGLGDLVTGLRKQAAAAP